MDQEQSCSSYLPREILLDILSRIPIKAVLTCKCVCKSWLDLLESPEFARSHLSKSAHGLLIHRATYTNNMTNKNVFKIFEFEDSLEIKRHKHRYKTVLEFNVAKTFDVGRGSGFSIKGSANGLIFLRNQSTSHYVCNPIKREFVKLPEIQAAGTHHQRPELFLYGFGVSRLSNQYKAVRIPLDCVSNPNKGLFGSIIRMSAGHVYTLGTESWRSITAPSGTLLDYIFSNVGTLLNGNLHWLARDSTGSLWISCFDLENEVLTKFRAPKVEPHRGRWYALAIGVLRDRLCLFDNSSSKSELSIYMKNDCGDGDKSWSKEYVIRSSALFAGGPGNGVRAVKAFADGDLLMVSSQEHPMIRYYSNRSKTIEPLGDTFEAGSVAYVEAMLYTPSFISLKDFETEDAKLFEFSCVTS